MFDDFARRFAALDLSPAQFSALVTIGANPGRRQSEIAGALGIQRPNFVAMMDELERRGLAERLRYARRPPLARLGADRSRRGAGRARAPRAGRTGKAVERLIGREGRERLVATLERLAELET